MENRIHDRFEKSTLAFDDVLTVFEQDDMGPSLHVDFPA